MNQANRARWGLLLTTLLLGAALVSLGFRGRQDAEISISAIVQNRTAAFQMQIRRAFRQTRGLGDEAARLILDELDEQGLSYLAVLGPGGQIRAQAGTPLAKEGADEEFRQHSRDPLVCRFVAEGQRVRAMLRIAANRRLRTPMGRARSPMVGKGLQHWRELRGVGLVIEFRPQLSDGIRRRADLNFLVSLAAAMVLALAAVVFWKLSLRHELVAAELAKGEQLKVLGEMSAVLSHELRNPLTSLKGHAQLVLEKVAGTKAERGARRVVTEAIRLERLAGQILDFARSGEVELAPCEVEALLRRSVEALPEASIAVAAEERLGSWPLDSGKMEQVLSNLARNALAASPEGEAPSMTALREGDELVIVVRDRGEGLPVGAEEKVFEPFFTRRVRGTGLGLAVARRIVEGHGGRILARNHVEGGAVFEIRLPRPKGE